MFSQIYDKCMGKKKTKFDFKAKAIDKKRKGILKYYNHEYTVTVKLNMKAF